MQAAQNTAQVFLGINLKCNSCHDSFISKWKLKDAYSLAAYFSTEERLQMYRCDVARSNTPRPVFSIPTEPLPITPSPADRRAAAADDLHRSPQRPHAAHPRSTASGRS